MNIHQLTKGKANAKKRNWQWSFQLSAQIVLLTVPSQRETQPHLNEEGEYQWPDADLSHPPNKAHSYFIRTAWFIITAYFWGYLDHLLSQSPGLSSPAGGLFRRAPSGSSSLRLTLLRGSAPGISCTAARRCGRPLCCRGFPPVCWGLGATQIKSTEGQDFSLHHPCFLLER